MRALTVILLVAAAAAFAWVNDHGADSSIPSGEPPVGTDNITLTLVGTITVPSAAHILGLDVQAGTDQVALVDNTGDKVWGVDGVTGGSIWDFDINYGGSMFNFAAAHTWPPTYDWYLNAWSDGSMHLYDPGTSSWSIPFANPAGQSGRGMAYNEDTGMLWESYTSGSNTRLYRIDDTGASQDWAVPEASGQISGVGLFWVDGDTWLFYTCYYDPTFYFYEYTGSGLDFQGTAATGVSVASSLGLAYCEDRDSFFWSYESGGSYYISEFEYNFTALEQGTWGSIKAEF